MNLVERVFEFFERLVGAREKWLGRIADFLFDDLGIPIELFFIGVALLSAYVHRTDLIAWWDHIGQRRDYKPVRSLTAWDQLEKHQQGYIWSVVYAIAMFLILGFVELFFGVLSTEK